MDIIFFCIIDSASKMIRMEHDWRYLTTTWAVFFRFIKIMKFICFIRSKINFRIAATKINPMKII